MMKISDFMLKLECRTMIHKIRRIKIKAIKNEKRIAQEKDKRNKLYGAKIIP